MGLTLLLRCREQPEGGGSCRCGEAGATWKVRHARVAGRASEVKHHAHCYQRKGRARHASQGDGLKTLTFIYGADA